ncbi:MAG: glycoside hydrolase family 3 C-terminal domain-containing protein [Anaerolineae bacterium]|jgi:beta-glucosidase|nr:glycoside hydrolase family 3 C-terminal domain-containing protein [Anaerolineae bacterium]
MTLNAVHLNPSLTAEQRVDALLSEMTLDEKLAQLTGIWVTELIDRERKPVADKLAYRLGYGIGHLTRVGASSLLPPTESAKLANTLQRYLLDQTRLKIPAIVHEESCAGYMARGATTFPQAMAMAAMWEPELVEDIARIIRRQMRAVGAHHALAPVLDVVRDPRWGRVEETFGEDPFLISAVGAAYIRGLQGDSWDGRVIATAKHFAAYGISEGGMNWAPVHVPEREFREMFLTPFRAAVLGAGIESVMPAYHELDGVPCHADKWLLVDILRNEMGFNGTVVSDYFGINQLREYHHVTGDKQGAARLAIEAGVDVELPNQDCYGDPLKAAVESGQVDIGLIDACVRRVLRQKVMLGLFEDPYVDDGRVIDIYSDAGAIALSREAAGKGVVLLKNDGILPLTSAHKTIAIIGPAAHSIRSLQGDYHYPSHLEGMFDPDQSLEAPNPAQPNVKIDWTAHFPPSVTALDGVISALGEQAEIVYAKGCDIDSSDTSGFAEAAALAKGADVAVVVVGDKAGLAKGATSGESIDRADICLPGVQSELVQAIAATGTPVVVVLIHGRPFALSDIEAHASAILTCWQPAEQGGAALADVLTGAVNPGGKLPMSFPRAVGQIPVYYNHKPSGGRTHWQGDYIDLSTKPLYPFGHGLSYTQFDYSDLHLSAAEVDANGKVEISATVTNTGERAGDEVVQLYVGDPVSSVTRPVKALKGFKRVHLSAGQSKRVTFHLSAQHLAFYGLDMRYQVEPGEVTVMVGASSADIRLNGSFTITGASTPVEQVYFTPVEVH